MSNENNAEQEIVDNDPLGVEEEFEESESGTYEIEETVSSVAQETMVGDLRDVCLQIIRNPKLTGKAWKDMDEAQQRDVAQQITDRVKDSVVKAVRIVAANGQRQIIGVGEKVKIDKDQPDLPSGEQEHDEDNPTAKEESADNGEYEQGYNEETGEINTINTINTESSDLT